MVVLFVNDCKELDDQELDVSHLKLLSRNYLGRSKVTYEKQRQQKR